MAQTKHIDNLDDWKSEYLPRLQNSYIYSSLKEDCATTDVEVTALVENAVAFALIRSKKIIKHMGEFTLHDDVHLFRVLYLMERLLTKAVINNLSIPEKMLLIISAFFHDIGMSPDEKEIITWQKIWDINPIIDDNEKGTFDNFKRFYNARPEQQDFIDKLIEQGKNSEVAVYVFKRKWTNA